MTQCVAISQTGIHVYMCLHFLCRFLCVAQIVISPEVRWKVINTRLNVHILYCPLIQICKVAYFILYRLNTISPEAGKPNSVYFKYIEFISYVRWTFFIKIEYINLFICRRRRHGFRASPNIIMIDFPSSRCAAATASLEKCILTRLKLLRIRTFDF